MERRIRPILTALVGAALVMTAGTAKGDEFYYVMIFGSQSEPKLLQYTHTWATFVRAVGEGPESAEAASAAQSLPAGLGTTQVQQPADDADDAELAKYNAYLARLNEEVKGTHGKRYGFR